MSYTITAFATNTPGVLYRISDLFLRRKVNIESLTVSETERAGVSRFTIVVHQDKSVVDKIVKQLYRVIEISKVYENTDVELVFKEVAFIKVSTKTPIERREVEEIATLFSAKIAHTGADYLILEKTGTEESIDSLRMMVKPFGIKEFVRSGRISLVKEEQISDSKKYATPKELSQVTSGIELSAIKRIELMGRIQGDVVSLAQGIPVFDTPDHIRHAAKKAIDEGLADKYTPGYGIEPLREAVVQKVWKENSIKATNENVIITHGGIEAVMAVFLSLLNRDDELLLLTPDYASHITQAIIAHNGSKPVFVPLIENADGWVLDPARLEGAITQKTKAIMICNPSNPVGKVYTHEELKEIARIALKYNLYIISDEMYEYFLYDNKKHISIGSFPEVADRTISIFGLSKSFCMTGWRIGYLVAHQKITKELFKVHDSLVTCPTAVSQYAALEAINGPKDDVNRFLDGFTKNRQIVVDELHGMDAVSLSAPEGGYYAFVKLNNVIDDYDFAVRAVREGKVAVVPGSAFGLGGEGHIRISYGCSEEQLREGMKRLTSFIKKNK